jgi:hypothetical protein
VYDSNGAWLAGGDDTGVHLEAVEFDLAGPPDGCWSPVFYVRVHPTFDAEPVSGRVLSYFGYYGLDRSYSGTPCSASGCDQGAWRQCWATFNTFDDGTTQTTCTAGGYCALFDAGQPECPYYAACGRDALTGTVECSILDPGIGSMVPYTPQCVPMPIPEAGGAPCTGDTSGPGWYGWGIDYGVEWVGAPADCCSRVGCGTGNSRECLHVIDLLCAQ